MSEAENGSVPGGASSLIGLFAPPPPPPDDDTNDMGHVHASSHIASSEQTSSVEQGGSDLSQPQKGADDTTVGPEDSAGETADAMQQQNRRPSLRDEFSRRSTARMSNNSHTNKGAEDTVEGPEDSARTADTDAMQQNRRPSLRDEFTRRSTARMSNNSHTKTLMEMFEDPDEQPVPSKERSSPTRIPPHERLPLLHNRIGSVEETAFGDLYAAADHHGSFSFADMFTSPTEPTPKTSGRKSIVTHQHARTHTRTNSITMPSIDEQHISKVKEESVMLKRWREFRQHHLQATTIVGACMFLLYHVVFCLAMASSIIRQHSETPILGVMAKMAACGVIFCAPVYLYSLGREIPALYPTVDLFLAPFMGKLATIVDGTLQADDTINGKDEDQVFVATLAALSGIGMILSGLLLVLAGKFKLANLGSYLPFPVLCGFFSAVGLLMWTLAFQVDTNGKSVAKVFGSGDWALIGNSLLHHLPSFCIAVVMKWLGPRNPFFVSMLVVTTIVLFYTVMAVTGTTLHQAREDGWFWSSHDLVYQDRVSHVGFDRWAPPAPFGVLNTIVQNKIHWGAVAEGMSTVLALSFLYLLRCSLHGTALKKNVSNLARPAKESEIVKSPMIGKRQQRHRRLFSEALDIEAVASFTQGESTERPLFRAKTCHVSLERILNSYGHSQFGSALVGGFGVTPSVAASPTMFSLEAEGLAPQYGSLLLLVVFYLTDFRLASYIPKAAFSSLICLACLDIMITWFLNSYKKTSDKSEWLVVPVIIVCAFVVGLLNAVFLGIAASTVLFVASFFRSGVVKFAASGLTVRSTIERTLKSGIWLDEHGYLIQILVLQNYLFFGNASSILTYISSMFDEPEDDELLPKPKFVILDFSLVTGMDTSTVDVIAGILSMCHSHDCKVFLSGLQPRLQTILSYGGVKPESGERAKRMLRFFPDLDSAIGKAEDMLLDWETDSQSKPEILDSNRQRLISEGDAGFRRALRQIDEQHGRHFTEGLIGLEKYTSPLELAPGESLFSSDGGSVAVNEGGSVEVHERGLCFIEEGLIKIVRDSSVTLTRGISSIGLNGDANGGSTRHLKSRGGSIGQRTAQLNAARRERTSHFFRIARVGPGWIVGTMEGVGGMENQGSYVAVSHCRLHHLPFRKMQEMEEEDPVLVLRLYKLLAHTMARRQEVTVEQLATLQSIITSPAQTTPLSRASQKIM